MFDRKKTTTRAKGGKEREKSQRKRDRNKKMRKEFSLIQHMRATATTTATAAQIVPEAGQEAAAAFDLI